MSIVKMERVQLVGELDSMYDVIREVVLDGNVHIIDAANEIRANKIKLDEKHFKARNELVGSEEVPNEEVNTARKMTKGFLASLFESKTASSNEDAPKVVHTENATEIIEKIEKTNEFTTHLLYISKESYEYVLSSLEEFACIVIHISDYENGVVVLVATATVLSDEYDELISYIKYVNIPHENKTEEEIREYITKISLETNFEKMPNTRDVSLDVRLEQRSFKKATRQRNFDSDDKTLEDISKLFSIKGCVRSEHLTNDYDYDGTMKEIRTILNIAKPVLEKVTRTEETIKEKEKLLGNLEYISTVDSQIENILSMQNIKLELVKVSKDGYAKLKLNDENVPAVVLHIMDEKDGVILLTATIEEFDLEYHRMFDSLNYHSVKLPTGYSGSILTAKEQLAKEIEQLKAEAKKLRSSIVRLEERYRQTISRAFSIIEIEKRVEEVRTLSAVGDRLFCIYGFIPKPQIKALRHRIGSIGKNIQVEFMPAEEREAGITPPTKIKTAKFFAPFKFMVNMYGVPSYDELDPTAFFALTYMLLFGAMFGDVGQGGIILLGGAIYSRKSKDFGGILMRLGVSSILFGFAYGSVFGNEELIPHLIIHPMGNIMSMLVAAVVLGFLLLTISYIYGLINFARKKDVEEGLFSKEGLAGLLFFLTFTIFVVNLFIPFGASNLMLIIILAVLLLITVFKEPLANIVLGNKKLFKQSKVDYFLESGFGSIETVLSALSSLISFIRVGAFALNHAGLYTAFAVMGSMFNSSVGNVVMLIVGNIVIIGLEGLIVFVQSMRLEYYELFSKYYTGEGTMYEPVRVGCENSE